MDVSPSGGGAVELNQTALSSYPFSTTFDNGESVQFKAVPAPGYQFDSWSGDLSGNINPSTVVVDCTKGVTANFSRVARTLTIGVSGNGSTTPEAGSHSYSDGVVVVITATPDSVWQFVGWSGDVTEPSLPTITVVMDADKAFIASFTQNVHTLSMQVSGSGSVTPAVGTHSYSEGAVVVISANPDSGWEFDGWSGDVTEPSLSTARVVMDSDRTFTANFSQTHQTKIAWWPIVAAITGIIIIGGLIWLAGNLRRD